MHCIGGSQTSSNSRTSSAIEENPDLPAQNGIALQVVHMDQLGPGSPQCKLPLYGFQVSRAGHWRIPVVMMAEHKVPGAQKVELVSRVVEIPARLSNSSGSDGLLGAHRQLS